MVKKTQREFLPLEAEPPAYEASATDLISDLLARVIQMAPGFTAALAAQVERETREKWGGDRVYVQRKGGTLSQRNAQIKREFRSGERAPFLARRHKLSERRVWEILNG